MSSYVAEKPMTEKRLAEKIHKDCIMNVDEFQLICRELGWSNGRVAREIGVTRRTVRRWVNDEHKIPYVVARLFNVLRH